MISPGDFFGETAFLSFHPLSRRRFDVIALDYCFVDVLTREGLKELIKEFPHLDTKL